MRCDESLASSVCEQECSLPVERGDPVTLGEGERRSLGFERKEKKRKEERKGVKE